MILTLSLEGIEYVILYSIFKAIVDDKYVCETYQIVFSN
jgi:hypothetical protein